MSHGTGNLPATTHPTHKAYRGWLGALSGVENLLLAMGLFALLLLPIGEMVLRSLFRGGISGASAFEQHFTLFIGMLGGAIAAREERLLSLSTLSYFLKGRLKALTLIFSNTIAATITFFLLAASVQFLLTEKSGGKILAYHIPIWVLQLLLPAGFCLIGLRLVWFASKNWKGRLTTLLLTGLLIAFASRGPIDPENLAAPSLLLLLLATLLGAPIFTAIGGVTLILLWREGLPIAAIPLKHYALVTSPILPTIPLFALAGYFLAEGGASKRLVRVFQALVGQFRGGPAIATALVCAFFTSFTGASGVTILALGGLLFPVLIQSHYSEKNALGLLTASGSLGLLFPPCIPLILYSITAGSVISNLGTAQAEQFNITMEKMFLGGIGPGIVLVLLTAWWGISMGSKDKTIRQRFNPSEAGKAIWEAKWELLLPAVALGTLFGGFATPVEAAAVTALYAFITESLIYRDLKPGKDLLYVMTECGLLVGGVLLILGVAMGFSYYLIYEQVPSRAVEWVTASIHSRWLFLLTLNGFLILVGCLMDIFSAIVVVVPLLVPLGLAYGIDPIHLGIIFLANLELGYLTPPVGMNLFLSSYRFQKSMPAIIRSVWPMFLVLLFGVLLITYFPFLSTTLPKLIE